MNLNDSLIFGDIWVVELFASDGHDQEGWQPAIIIQDQEYGKGLPFALGIPITSQLGDESLPLLYLIRGDDPATALCVTREWKRATF